MKEYLFTVAKHHRKVAHAAIRLSPLNAGIFRAHMKRARHAFHEARLAES